MRRDEIDTGHGRTDGHVGDPDGLLQQQIVDGVLKRRDVDPGRHRQTGLRIEIERKHPAAAFGERGGDVEGAGGLGGAALLVEEGDDAGHRWGAPLTWPQRPGRRLCTYGFGARIPRAVTARQGHALALRFDAGNVRDAVKAAVKGNDLGRVQASDQFDVVTVGKRKRMPIDVEIEDRAEVLLVRERDATQ